MTDERAQGEEGGAADEVEIGLEAPERGSAAELMDHGASGELGPMRHSAAHVLAEAVLRGPVPRTASSPASVRSSTTGSTTTFQSCRGR